VVELTKAEEATLLRWARAALTGPAPQPASGELTAGLRAPAAAFVTLEQAGQLRGCIGYLQHDRPLWENVVRAARAAAQEDPRFPPVTAAEVPGLRVKISVLDPPLELADVARFDPQRHGIIVEREGHRGLLLPQVARERGWDAAQTLAAVCTKAGLPPQAWREAGTRLQVFTAREFGEAE
jgi:AmmeMemoRadiSam system protein A